MMKETGESDDQRRVQILFSFPQNFDVRAKESSSSPSYSLFLYSRLCFAFFSHLLFRLSFTEPDSIFNNRISFVDNRVIFLPKKNLEPHIFLFFLSSDLVLLGIIFFTTCKWKNPKLEKKVADFLGEI